MPHVTRRSSGGRRGTRAQPGRRRTKPATRDQTPRRRGGRPEAPTPSPPWLPIAILVSLVAGTIVVMASYWGLPGGVQQLSVMAAGALLFLAGLVMATRYR